MSLKQAIQILKTHNKWRRGADIEATNPTLLGEAIDCIIMEFELKTINKN